MSLAKAILRILTVMAREVVEVCRRPKALLGIIAGPVLILGLFGLGWVGQPPLRTVLVIPASSGLSTDPATYAAVAGDRIRVLGVTQDPAAADAELAAGSADLVVIAPADAADRLAANEQAVLQIHYDTVSPYREFIARAAAEAIVTGVNRQVITEIARDVKTRASANGVDTGVSPDLVAAPTRAEVIDRAPSRPDLVAFYGLMVLALIVQHTVITVSALSVLHDRRLGMLDLFRISPISAGELLAGKYAAFTLLGSAVALITLGALIGAFHVPFLAQPGIVVACLALLVMASIGIGSVVALRSDSDRQAIQVSLLILVASVFFSGLAIDLNQFSVPVQVAGALLPVTQAGTVLQDLILRSASLEMWRIGILGALAAGLFVIGWLMLRRQLMRPA